METGQEIAVNINIQGIETAGSKPERKRVLDSDCEFKGKLKETCRGAGWRDF